MLTEDKTYNAFIERFKGQVSGLGDKVRIFKDKNDVYISRRYYGTDCIINMRLLYRMSSLEGFKQAFEYFISDQLKSDIEDKSIPGQVKAA